MSEIYSVETFKPNRSFGRLVARVRLAMVERLSERLKPLDLTSAQWGVIIYLADGTASTPAELARMLDYDPGALTRLIDRLETKGFVTRERNVEDRRSINLALTDAGKALYPQIMPMVVGVYNEMLEGLKVEEVDELESLLLRVLETNNS